MKGKGQCFLLGVFAVARILKGVVKQAYLEEPGWVDLNLTGGQIDKGGLDGAADALNVGADVEAHEDGRKALKKLLAGDEDLANAHGATAAEQFEGDGGLNQGAVELLAVLVEREPPDFLPGVVGLEEKAVIELINSVEVKPAFFGGFEFFMNRVQEKYPPFGLYCDSASNCQG